MSSFRSRIFSLALDGDGKVASMQRHAEVIDAASACKTKEAAMAFGYILGQEDAKKGAPFPESSIQEQVISVIEQFTDGEFDQEYAADLVFGLIYKWLDKMYEDQGFIRHDAEDFVARWYLAEAFQPFVKPGVINPPLPSKEKA